MTTIVYTRQSLDKTGLAAGVERQLAESLELAERRGIEIERVLSDNDLSATTGKTRPAFEELLKFVESGTVDRVVVWHVDRLYRTLKDLTRITEIAKVHGLDILTVQAGDIDLSTPSGRMVASMLGSVATYEGEHRTARQRAAFKQRAEAGEWHFAHRPFGYKRVDGAVVIVEHEAAILRELFQRYYEGESRHSLVRDLNKRGILTAMGKSWSITQLRAVLGNERYAGYASYKGERTGMGNWVPIIDPETYDRYVSAAASRKAVTTTFSREATSLLSGLITCAECESTCYRRQRKGTDQHGDKVYEYACAVNRCVSMNANAADKAVTDEVVSALLFMPSSAIPGESTASPLEALTASLASVLERRGELVSLVTSGVLKASDVAAELAELNAEEERLTTVKNAHMRENVASDVLQGIRGDLLSGGRVDLSDAVEAKKRIRARFLDMTLPRRRELVRLTVELRLGKVTAEKRLDIRHIAAVGLVEE
ncbi:recombinase family protein [Agromyces atrinae]|uniref:DNA invertase Pin-like site-specific DNA recombinase n=1 Tax=Agromyces atrinae TaxID=592376 RepID=A0A4Q2M2Y4_9MICO|nr:recombinase family protein [Agromyces atrinae]NYD65995.1 DNA invertase Pin-like site-specific DNA recombinase [Agromyces atrinae]RXZ86325.1 recombinase family protein [Agromyces atrinae]